ncbi:MAG: GGDEF domain-containing protein [Sandaracinus sp.]|nr:GGDEF domain-containing protein [Myxococcales bacterium]MAT25033.1 GGDEF domain-containing protein [Sandaracinus sp.]MBJ74041.1 GGDEF domain-containing protein [Sandaracinus sp.]
MVTVVGPAGAGGKKKASREACLVVIYGEDLGRRIPLADEPVVIGRSSRCEVQIDQESVSRNHCRISYNGRGYGVRDLGSTNGTYVNDELVDTMDLRDGDQLKVGRTILKFIVGGNIEGQYHEEIYRLMTMDGLTQVHNKRYFDEMLERELSRARRYERTFCLILFDIDHFKQINDTYGHLAGDAVLRQLGTVVRTHVRRDDIIARTGGEEFGIITPEVGLHGAVELAKKLNRLVDEQAFEFEGTRIAVTISLGVCEWDEAMQSTQAIVQASDEKLYEAKRTGRNKVCA